MLLIAIVLALVVAGMLVVLVLAFSQNRGLWEKLRASGRPVPALLRDALVLWSPLALLIVVSALAANRLGAAAASLTWRASALDEFCQVLDLPARVVIPCTGMDGVLPPGAVRPAGPQADIESMLSLRYRQARVRLMAATAGELREALANRPAFDRLLSPQGVLGLERAPEDDPELARLARELDQLRRTPARPAAGIMDLVRFVGERDARERRIAELSAAVAARRRQLDQAAYAGLAREAQGRAWLRHRLSHLLATIDERPDAATEAALASLHSNPAQDAATLPLAQRGLLLMLARGEAAAARILVQESGTRAGRAGLYLSLPMTRRCRLDAPVEGEFDCQELAGLRVPLRLRPLGFQESVQRSIDRWYDQASASAFRRAGRLSLAGAALAGDAGSATRAMSVLVPEGIKLGRTECGVLHPGGCLENLARESAEAGFARVRAREARRYEQQAGAAAGALAQTLDQRIAAQLPGIDAAMDGMREATHDYASRLFLVNLLLRILGWLAVALVAVKSFLYVLALEVFHSDEDMSFGFDVADPVEGDYRAARQLTIDRDFAQPMITRKQLSNADNNLCLAPWPGSSPLARILRGRYFVFTRGSFLADAGAGSGATQSPRGMVASAGGGLSIVEWRLQPGEQVVFRYQDFFGASQNLRLDSEWSFRLSTLLLGRVRFHVATCAEGEGRLLLKANVEDLDPDQLRAIPPERMIAYSRHARFTIHSGRTLWKTLLNGYTLVRAEPAGRPGGKIVVSSDEASSNLGSIRFVRRIFTAIF